MKQRKNNSSYLWNSVITFWRTCDMAYDILQTLLFFIHQAHLSASSAPASRMVAVQLQEGLLRVRENFAQQSKQDNSVGKLKQTCRLPQRARSVVQRLVLQVVYRLVLPLVQQTNKSELISENGSKSMLHRVVQRLVRQVQLQPQS